MEKEVLLWAKETRLNVSSFGLETVVIHEAPNDALSWFWKLNNLKKNFARTFYWFSLFIVWLSTPTVGKPVRSGGNKSLLKPTYPAECRERHSSYKADMNVKINWRVNGGIINSDTKSLGQIPIMVGVRYTAWNAHSLISHFCCVCRAWNVIWTESHRLNWWKGTKMQKHLEDTLCLMELSV